jgi:hypothetical protein
MHGKSLLFNLVYDVEVSVVTAKQLVRCIRAPGYSLSYQTQHQCAAVKSDRRWARCAFDRTAILRPDSIAVMRNSGGTSHANRAHARSGNHRQAIAGFVMLLRGKAFPTVTQTRSDDHTISHHQTLHRGTKHPDLTTSQRGVFPRSTAHTTIARQLIGPPHAGNHACRATGRPCHRCHRGNLR